MYKRILVATDGSPLSKKAVAGAIGLAAKLEAELVAVKVVPRYPLNYIEGGMAVSMEEARRTEQQWLDAAAEVVKEVETKAAAKGVVAKAVTVKSDQPSEAIIAAAKKQNCDLIVMASHGRRGIKRLLLGSETQHVLTHSTIPVLVLR